MQAAKIVKLLLMLNQRIKVSHKGIISLQMETKELNRILLAVKFRSCIQKKIYTLMSSGQQNHFGCFTFALCQVLCSSQHKELLGPKDCVLR